MTDKISDLSISLLLKDELIARGYDSVEQLRPLSIFDAAQITWMNGADWKTINQALGRKVFPDVY